MKSAKLFKIKIQDISLNKISDITHGYYGHKIEDEWNDYSDLINNMKLGIVNPVLLRKYENKFIILDGWHRIEIAKKLKWKTIPAGVVTSEKERLFYWKIFKRLGFIVE